QVTFATARAGDMPARASRTCAALLRSTARADLQARPIAAVRRLGPCREARESVDRLPRRGRSSTAAFRPRLCVTASAELLPRFVPSDPSPCAQVERYRHRGLRCAYAFRFDDAHLFVVVSACDQHAAVHVDDMRPSLLSEPQDLACALRRAGEFAQFVSAQ